MKFLNMTFSEALSIDNHIQGRDVCSYVCMGVSMYQHMGCIHQCRGLSTSISKCEEVTYFSAGNWCVIVTVVDVRFTKGTPRHSAGIIL